MKPDERDLAFDTPRGGSRHELCRMHDGPCILSLSRVYCYYDLSFGELNGVVVVLVHADREGDMHVISLRKAERYETRYYLEAAEDSLGGAD